MRPDGKALPSHPSRGGHTRHPLRSPFLVSHAAFQVSLPHKDRRMCSYLTFFHTESNSAFRSPIMPCASARPPFVYSCIASHCLDFHKPLSASRGRTLGCTNMLMSQTTLKGVHCFECAVESVGESFGSQAASRGHERADGFKGQPLRPPQGHSCPLPRPYRGHHHHTWGLAGITGDQWHLNVVLYFFCYVVEHLLIYLKCICISFFYKLFLRMLYFFLVFVVSSPISISPLYVRRALCL